MDGVLDFITEHKFVRFFIWMGMPFLLFGLYAWLAFKGNTPNAITLTLALYLPIASFLFMLAFDFMSESSATLAKEILAVIGILVLVIPSVVYQVSTMSVLADAKSAGTNALTSTGWGLTVLPAIAIGIFLMYIWIGFDNSTHFTVFALPIGFFVAVILMLVLVVLFGMSLFTFAVVTSVASLILFAIMLFLRLRNGSAFEAV